MWKLRVLILLASMLLLPANASAQGVLSIESLRVSFWPEYDRQDMLVIYHILLSPETAFPAEVVLRIPASAQKPYVVAVGQTPETVSDQNIQFSTRQNDAWVDVVILTEGPAITLEYYDPAFLHEDMLRRYDYTWPGDYAIQQGRLELLLPQRASKLTTEPSLTLQDGLYVGTVPPTRAGQSFHVKIAYERNTEAVTTSGGSVKSAEPSTNNTEWAVRMTAVWPWVFGILGISLIVGGALYYWLSGRGKKRAQQHRSTGRNQTTEPIHCHQCGQRAKPGDRFCRTCGTLLRQTQ